MRSLSSLPSSVAALQTSVNALLRSQESLTASLRRDPRAREVTVDVPENVWEAFRSRAWPLTPWLVGLRETQGLPGLVVDFLGRRTLVEGRRERGEAVSGLTGEVGRLVADRVEWTREEIRALGVYA